MRTRRAVLVVVLCVSAAAAIAQQNQVRDRAMGPYRAGLAEMRTEAYDKAEKAFQEAVEIDPDFDMAYYMLGRAQMPQKKFAAAVASFARARDLHNASAGRRFSTVQDAQHARRDRIVEIDEALRQLQGAPQTNQTMTYIRQLSEQRRLIQESIQRGTGLSIASTVPPYVSLSLGSAYFRLGQMKDAEREFKAAIAADPRTGEAHNNLAVVYYETGRYPEAKASLRAAEKAGVKVHPALKAQINAKGGSD